MNRLGGWPRKRKRPPDLSLDPNKDRNDPMVPEYWLLGEDLQDRIRGAGYDSPTVEGIAVDIHDLPDTGYPMEPEVRKLKYLLDSMI